MSNKLFKMMAQMKSQTFDEYNVTAMHDAVKLYPNQGMLDIDK